MDSKDDKNNPEAGRGSIDGSDDFGETGGVDSGGSVRDRLKRLARLLPQVFQANMSLAERYREMADGAEDQETRDLLRRLEQRVLIDNKEFHDSMSNNIRCPQCLSEAQIRIVYGEPNPRWKDKVIVGGPVATDEDPMWFCKDCQHKWRYTKEHLDEV